MDFDPLDDADCAAVKLSIEQAQSLPNRAYVDPRWYQLERTRIFSRRWVAVAFGHQLESPGDALPVSVAGVPILLVRDELGVLRAFHNVCAYDSCMVLLEPAAGLTQFVGPYHGWTWALDGTLTSIPYWDGTPEPALDVLPVTGDLSPVHCATWLDLIFVHLGEAPIPFADLIAPVNDRLSDIDVSEFTVTRDARGAPLVSEHTIPANWKIAFENDVELLHEAFVHEEYAKSPFSPKVDKNGNMTCLPVADRGLYGLAAPIAEYYDADEPYALPLLPVRDRPHIERFHIYDLYPNVQMGFGAEHFTLGFFEHDDPFTTRNRVAYYTHRTVANDPDIGAVISAGWEQARIEDNVVCAATQRGKQSTAVSAGFYAPFWDHLIHTFHQHVLRDLAE